MKKEDSPKLHETVKIFSGGVPLKIIWSKSTDGIRFFACPKCGAECPNIHLRCWSCSRPFYTTIERKNTDA